jgi:hypothetical protein
MNIPRGISCTPSVCLWKNSREENERERQSSVCAPFFLIEFTSFLLQEEEEEKEMEGEKGEEEENEEKEMEKEIQYDRKKKVKYDVCFCLFLFFDYLCFLLTQLDPVGTQEILKTESGRDLFSPSPPKLPTHVKRDTS